jgi:tetratricopeptide (TPR) repeat protein
VYNLEKKPDEALKEYETALKANPKYAPALRAKVGTLVQQKRVDEALGVVQASLKGDPKNAELITTLAALHGEKGDKKKAEEEFKRAIQTDEKYAPARFALARMLLAGNRERGDRPAPAHPDRPLSDTPRRSRSPTCARQVRATRSCSSPRSSEPTVRGCVGADLPRKGRFDYAVALPRRSRRRSRASSSRESCSASLTSASTTRPGAWAVPPR